LQTGLQSYKKPSVVWLSKIEITLQACVGWGGSVALQPVVIGCREGGAISVQQVRA